MKVLKFAIITLLIIAGITGCQAQDTSKTFTSERYMYLNKKQSANPVYYIGKWTLTLTPEHKLFITSPEINRVDTFYISKVVMKGEQEGFEVRGFEASMNEKQPCYVYFVRKGKTVYTVSLQFYEELYVFYLNE